MAATRKRARVKGGWALAPTLLLFGSLAVGAAAQERQTADSGKEVYKRANCVGCHKWHGDGGGGYGGDALSLRKTQLTREQIIETVRCGRPGTGMPYFQRDVYEGKTCYDSTKEDLGKSAPMEAGTYLRPAEMEAVADYVLKNIQGRGEPGYADCAAFFGESSRMCGIYKKDDGQKTN